LVNFKTELHQISGKMGFTIEDKALFINFIFILTLILIIQITYNTQFLSYIGIHVSERY
jgi:hypothetical protein